MPESMIEWLFSTWMGRQRAAEVVGDLVEEHRHGWRVWRAVLSIVLAAFWRPALGLTLAASTLVWSTQPFLLQLRSATTPPTALWQIFALASCYAGLFLWPVVFLAAAKFGARSPTTAIALLLAAMFTLASGVSGNDATGLHFIVAAMLALLVLFLLSRPAYRRPSLVIAGSSLVLCLVESLLNVSRLGLLSSAILHRTQIADTLAMYNGATWVVAMLASYCVLSFSARRPIPSPVTPTS